MTDCTKRHPRECAFGLVGEGHEGLAKAAQP